MAPIAFVKFNKGTSLQENNFKCSRISISSTSSLSIMLASTKGENTCTKLFARYYHSLPSSHIYSNFIVTVTEHIHTYVQNLKIFSNTVTADCTVSTMAAAAALWCCHCYQLGLGKTGNDDIEPGSIGDNGNNIDATEQNQSFDRRVKGYDDGIAGNDNSAAATLSSYLFYILLFESSACKAREL